MVRCEHDTYNGQNSVHSSWEKLAQVGEKIALATLGTFSSSGCRHKSNNGQNSIYDNQEERIANGRWNKSITHYKSPLHIDGAAVE